MTSKRIRKPVAVFKSDTSANPVDLPLEAKDLQTKIHEFIRLPQGLSALFAHICGVGEIAAEKNGSRRGEQQSEGQDAVRFVAQGVIAQLTREHGGNVATKGIIDVTASGCWAGDPENVADLGTNSFFYSSQEGDQNPWICYDLKRWCVSPISYSIRSGACAYPRSWVLEVSNDGSNWTVVDRRRMNKDLNAPYVTRNFVIDPRPQGSYRFIRFCMTGKNEKGLNEFLMTSFEIFAARPVKVRELGGNVQE